MKINIDKKGIPLFIAIVLLVVSLVITTFSVYKLGYQQYGGLLLVAVSAILYFKHKRVYRYIFGFTLLVGTIGLIDFFYIRYRFGIGVFGLNPIGLALLILFLVLDKETVNQFFPDSGKPESGEADKLKKTEARIDRFEQKFASKTEAELKQITNLNNAYVEEARIAADRILKRKRAL